MARPKGYSRRQIQLHWIITALIALQYIFHNAIVEAWEATREGIETAFNPLVAGHVVGGGLVLLLVLWRLAIRFRRGAPPPPEAEHPMLKLAAHATHWTLYALMILMPVSGALAWFGGVELAAEGHSLLRIVLLALTGLHIVAALFHQFVLRTGLMERMKTPG